MSEKKYDWDAILADYEKAFKRTGISMNAYSKKKGLPISNLSKHRRMKKAKEATDTVAIQESAFLPVTIVEDECPPKAPVETLESMSANICLSVGKVQLMISSGFNPELLKSVLEVILPLC